MGRKLGATHTINVREVEDSVEAVKEIVGKPGADYVIECAGTEGSLNDSIHMTNRGGKICLAAFPHEPCKVDLPYAVMNNIYMYGIRGEGKSGTYRAMSFMKDKRFDATAIHTHTFALDDLPEALRYARERVDGAIKVIVKARGVDPIKA